MNPENAVAWWKEPIEVPRYQLWILWFVLITSILDAIVRWAS